ncbi:MAG: hypothetical protein A3J28_11860 [Acidobacteria bacterium RIFCSPLOWO2_12_FULL_60_22]|nr:MAG: hypothetical protein A3J28_11860 [Acidobacteria bacterium RIFCSPLOWO2_12_FULL_60_22]
MKTKRTQRLRIFLGLSLFVTAGLAAPLFAQSKKTLVAKIPFEFVVGDRTLPASEYIVEHVFWGSSAIRIQTEDGPGPYGLTTSMLVQRPVHEAEGKLIFHRYGDTYFLSQVWLPTRITGQQVPKPKRERELAQQVNSRPQVASITARAR